MIEGSSESRPPVESETGSEGQYSQETEIPSGSSLSLLNLTKGQRRIGEAMNPKSLENKRAAKLRIAAGKKSRKNRRKMQREGGGAAMAEFVRLALMNQPPPLPEPPKDPS
jgi:hypothetical protein